MLRCLVPSHGKALLALREPRSHGGMPVVCFSSGQMEWPPAGMMGSTRLPGSTHPWILLHFEGKKEPLESYHRLVGTTLDLAAWGPPT